MSFKIKIKEDNKVLFKAQFEELDDFDNAFKDLKRKFRGNKNG